MYFSIIDGGINFETIAYIVVGILGAALVLFCTCFWVTKACNGSSGQDVKKLLKRLNSLQQRKEQAQHMKESRSNGAGILKNGNQFPDGELYL